MIHTISVVILAAVLFANFVWRYYHGAKSLQQARAALSRLPVVKFDENDTPQRYITESGKLLQEGYRKYLKKGQAFQMRDPVDEARPQIILPLSYLDEVKNAPVSRLSFTYFSEKSFLLKYTGGPVQTENAVTAIKINLTKSLGDFVVDMHEECVAALGERLPPMDDWTDVKIYEVFALVVARVTSRIFVGSELCRNPEWIGLMIGITMDAHMASQTIRATYGPQWRWIASWVHSGAKRVFANRRKAAQLLLPLYARRMAARGADSKSNDGVQWLINAHRGKGDKTLEQLADEQAFVSVASIHTSTATATHLLYDIVSRPECVPGLLEEIRSALSEEPGGKWSRRSIAKLKKLDSFMKESQRINPIGMGQIQVTMQRCSPQPHTFKDGLVIPADHQICMPSYEINHDSDFYPEPDKFDGDRFLKLRESIDQNRFHFASVSDDSINFGAGSHACPGRFFAGIEIKMMIAELLLGFEMKFAHGEGRPANMVHDFSIIPNIGAEISMKSREKSHT